MECGAIDMVSITGINQCKSVILWVVLSQIWKKNLHCASKTWLILIPTYGTYFIFTTYQHVLSMLRSCQSSHTLLPNPNALPNGLPNLKFPEPGQMKILAQESCRHLEALVAKCWSLLMMWHFGGFKFQLSCYLWHTKCSRWDNTRELGIALLSWVFLAKSWCRAVQLLVQYSVVLVTGVTPQWSLVPQSNQMMN